ncbi:MAG: hypothetical protein ACKVJP_08645 [Flavobacteriales bacterium]|tara:strand:- start:429 stop:659 length:231 start_codon:yes stop_codon:yes gene_type:complete
MEHIKQKVEKLITAYKNKSAQLEQLKVENKNLLSRLSEIESKQESKAVSSRKNELLKQKVDLLTEEVDSCIALASV